MKSDTLWIFKSFGFRAGIKFLWDSLLLKVKRFFIRETPMRFEDLTDEEAEKIAQGFGIYKWDDRSDLNRIWHNFDKTLN